MPESSVGVGVGELGLVVSAGRLLGFSRSWGEGNRRLWRRGTGDAVTPSRRRQAARRASGVRGRGGSNQVVTFRESRTDRSIGGSQACSSDGRWASIVSVVGSKPPMENCRWGPKILGARCGRATCAGPKLGLPSSTLRHHRTTIQRSPATPSRIRPG